MPGRIARLLTGMTERMGSVRARLTFWILAVTLLVHSSFCLIVLSYQRNLLNDMLNTRLKARSASILGALKAADFAVDAHLDQLVTGNTPVTEPEVIAVTLYDGAGRAIASTRRPPPALPEFVRTLDPGGEPILRRTNSPPIIDENASGTRYRFALRTFDDDTGRRFWVFVTSGSEPT